MIGFLGGLDTPTLAFKLNYVVPVVALNDCHRQGAAGHIYEMAGCRRCQSVTFWNAAPARISVASPRCAATSWKAVGKPSALKPPDRVNVGWPAMLKGAV